MAIEPTYLVTFSVLCRERDGKEALLAQDLQSPVIPRVGEVIFVEGSGHTVEAIEYQFEDTRLSYILIRVYRGVSRA